MSDFDLKVEVREIPLYQLSENTGQIPDVPKNPRKITKEKFDALVESIRESPEMKVLDEVRVYPYNGRYVVISGNHRVKAYRKLGWQNVLCKILPEDTPKVKLREYVMKENMHYAENDDALLRGWDMKELANWRVPMTVKAKKQQEVPEVEFTQVLDESHNYVVLYFDNEVDWLQAQTLFGIKPVRLLSTAKDKNNVNGNKVGLGRVLRGSEVINRLLKENSRGSKTNRNK
jgi:uncharacterized ParB-like nuclease family protein